MRRIISSAIAATVVAAGLLLAILSGYIPNVFPDFAREHPVRFWGSLVGLAALLIGYAFAQYQVQASTTEPPIELEQARRNRQAMLENVRATWIAGVLDYSVARDARIALRLEVRPDAVITPVALVFQRLGRVAQQLPTGTAIRDIYDQFGGALLVLGAPGAGKTTLLLELTRDLLDRANDDPQHPIPVVFPLSIWTAQHRPLAAWLVDELVLRYQVSRSLAQAWIDADAILPLLDGLDEVAETHRTACADAINAYRESHGHLPLVVASRIADYEALTTRLQLHGAILAQPLDREQVRSYLRAVGVAAIPTRESPLWYLLDTPLMLTVAALAYAGQLLTALPADPAAARDRLFAAYIDRMFQRNNPQRPFTDEQTRHYLAFLAYQLQQHNQTTFYLEQMQPDWLPVPHRQRWKRLVTFTTTIVGGLGILLVATLVVALGVALVVVLGVARHGLIVLLVGILLFGLLLGLAGGLSGAQGDSIKPTEVVRWSWGRARSSFIQGLRLNPAFGLLGALLGSSVGGWGGALGAMLGTTLGIVLGGGIVNFIMGGLSEHTIERKISLNQGIRRSGINALAIWLGGGLIEGLVGALVFGLVGGLGTALLTGMVVGLVNVLGATLVLGLIFGLVGGLGVGLGNALVGGLDIALRYGGHAYLQHYTLRLLLIRNGSLPRRLAPFLDYATQRIFLRRVGGGYIFIHRLLLEHVAAQYIPPDAPASASASHTQHVP